MVYNLEEHDLPPLGEAVIYGRLDNRTYALVNITKKPPLQIPNIKDKDGPCVWYEPFSGINESDFRELLRTYKLKEVDLINFGALGPSDSEQFSDWVNAYAQDYLRSQKEKEMPVLAPISAQEEEMMKVHLDDFLRDPFAEKPIF